MQLVSKEFFYNSNMFVENVYVDLYFNTVAKDEPARDCTDIQNQGHTASGVYTVHATNSEGKAIEVEVYCDMSNGGGWLVSNINNTYV